MHGTHGVGYPSLCEVKTPIGLCDCPGWVMDGLFRSCSFSFLFAFLSIERAILMYIVCGLCACNYAMAFGYIPYLFKLTFLLASSRLSGNEVTRAAASSQHPSNEMYMCMRTVQTDRLTSTISESTPPRPVPM